ncbi:hypothetical protein B1NLA3E_16405 [Bacillus sp. 1NLA3E]|nr:hypothetical protein B1NLA3E_16405 [Bacillus sp. 1NLA3E]
MIYLMKRYEGTACKIKLEVKHMNKVVSSALAIGAGMAAFNLMKNNNMMSTRQMKKIGKRISKAF